MPGPDLTQFPSLTADQQDLLLRALSSQKRKADSIDLNPAGARQSQDRQNMVASPKSINPAQLDATAMNDLSSSHRFDPEAFNEESFNEFAASGDINFDDLDFTGDLSDLVPGVPVKAEPRLSFDGETGEKRKSPEDDDEDDEDDDIQKPGGKVNKKPGRKPLTTEPTTKRKAQNRAAQRAFRERKEQHLKDLEQKVVDLEKASEVTTTENGALRAQVTRLQTELREYRKRISITSPRSSLGPISANAKDGSANFDFSFPKFGALPNFHMPPGTETYGQTAQSQTNYQTNGADHNGSRQNSRSLSPGSNNGVANQNSPFNSYSNGQTSSSTPSDNLTDLFSPANLYGSSESSVSNTTSPNNQVLSTFTGGRSYSQNSNNAQKVRQDTQKSVSTASSAASPSSYVGLNGANSSCCTSPEPYRDSPQNKTIDNPTNVNGSNTQTDGFNWNSQAPANAQSPDFSFDWLANQNGGNFDPALFGDYRESQAAVIGSGEFNGGFFEESMTFANMDDPFAFNLSTDQTIPAPPPQVKPSLLEQVDQQRDGDCTKWADHSADEKELMTAHKIWNSLQNCPKFKSGDFDIDGLCSELQTKAKCSETGLVVPKADVEAALWRLAGVDGSMNNGENKTS